MSTPSETGASTRFAGSLSDGKAPTGVPVTVSLTPDGLEITAAESARRRIWHYGSLYSSAPLTARSRGVVLSESSLGTETLFVADPDFARALLAHATALGVVPRRVKALVPGVAVMAAAAVLAATIWIAGFDPAKTAAHAVPASARTTLGRNIIATLSSRRPSCETEAARLSLDRLTARLAAAAAEPPVPVRVVILDWGIANAFAAPGGQIVLTRGLIEQAGSSDEVAGVLAHEMGHSLELHPEASLIRGFGLSTGMQLVLVGAPTTLSSLGIILTQLRYSRVAEREADAHALRILKAAGISAAGFGAFFARLNASRPNSNRGKGVVAFDLVRTHPLTSERLALVAAQPSYPSTPALSDVDFRALRAACTPTSGRSKVPRALQELVRMPPPRPTGTASQVAEKSNLDRSIEEASAKLAMDAGDAAAWQARAAAYARKGQHQQALADYGRAIALKPGDAALHYGRAASLQNVRQYEAAVVAYDEAIRLAPAYVAAFNGRGNCNRALKRHESALVDFDEAVRLDPKFAIGYYNRGLVYNDLSRTEEAMRDFSAAITADKDYAGAYVQRALLYEKAGDRELAIADFRAGLAARPKFESGHWAQRIARERLTALGVGAP